MRGLYALGMIVLALAVGCCGDDARDPGGCSSGSDCKYVKPTPAHVTRIGQGVFLVDYGHEGATTALCNQSYTVEAKPKTPGDPKSDLIVKCQENLYNKPQSPPPAAPGGGYDDRF